MIAHATIKYATTSSATTLLSTTNNSHENSPPSDAAISRLRGQQEELPLEDAAAVAEEDFVALLCAKEDMEELMATMAQLPAAYRDALYTRYVMELPLREAAEMLGVKAETLRKQTARAKDLLAKKLREKGWDAYGRQ